MHEKSTNGCSGEKLPDAARCTSSPDITAISGGWLVVGRHAWSSAVTTETRIAVQPCPTICTVSRQLYSPSSSCSLPSNSPNKTNFLHRQEIWVHTLQTVTPYCQTIAFAFCTPLVENLCHSIPYLIKNAFLSLCVLFAKILAIPCSNGRARIFYITGIVSFLYSL